MKITCTQENFAAGLQLVSHVASKNISLPILNNVLIKAEKGILSLLTTNLEIGIVCQVRGKIEEEGAITVQAKTLSDYINLLPNENITLELQEQTLTVKASNSKTTMKGVDPSEFPLIPAVEAKQEYVLPAEVLKEGLSSVVFAAAFDETRPEISGVFFQFDGNTLTVAATDSYRLAEKKIPLEKQVDPHQVIIPMRTTQELIRVIGDQGGEVTIQVNENQIVFSMGAAKLTSRVIEGQYPDYRQIIPTENKTRASVSTAGFINTTKQASLFCKPGSNDVQIVLDQPKGELTVSAANVQVGESVAKHEAVIAGESNDIIFNHRFLLEGLQNISTDDCVLELNTNSSPGVLRPKDSNEYVYIIMPIKQ